MNIVRFFQKAKLALTIVKPSYYSIFTYTSHKYLYLNPKYASETSAKTFKSFKNISNCSSMQTNDTHSENNDKNSNELMQKVLEDEEFQNILKDFATDFEVDSESNEVLKDIRKNLDSKQEGNTTSDDKYYTSSDTALICTKQTLKKYKEFLDVDSSVIHSYEERYGYPDEEPTYHIDHELQPKSFSHNLKRGITGVFDIHELIQVLQSESLLDLTAISVPKEFHYADFLVLATAKSKRHCEAVAEFIIKLYKQKKSKKDSFIKVEGESSENWKVIDMGNIVLHIFLGETRALYDIESLWLFDLNYDSGGNIQEDPSFKIIEEQLAFFNSLQNQSTSTEMPEHAS